MVTPGCHLHRLVAPAGAPAARAWVTRCLEAAAPQRNGLPPTAIVVLRRVALRMARCRQDDALRPAIASALRPAALGFVPAGADGVWFADEAELLACLARDLLDGSAGMRWWWPLLLGSPPTVEAACARWCRQARSAPHALGRLAPGAGATRWLQTLGPPGRAALAEALAHAFDLGPLLSTALHAAESAGGAQGEAHGAGPRRASARPTPWTVGAATTPAPPPASGVDAVVLLHRVIEQLMMAPHAPAQAAWWQALLEPVAHRLVPPRPHQPTATIRQTITTVAANVRDRLPAAPRIDASVGQRRAARASMPEATSLARSGRHTPPAPAAAPWEVPVAEARRQPDPTMARDALSLDTRFAGLAFLLNTLIALDLIGDFTRPRDGGLPLSPWRLLHHAARASWGRRIAGDPFVRWLDERAGPPRDVPVPLPWHAPPAALRAFAADERPWHRLRDGHAERLWHPAGFVAACWPAGGEAHLPAPHRTVDHPPRHGTHPPRLAALLWPLLRARIALALGLPDGDAAARLLFSLPGRLHERHERIDVHLPLAALPIGVRLAGLDRDPGWIPAIGRDLRFHFD